MTTNLQEMITAAKKSRLLTEEDMLIVQKEVEEFKQYILQSTRLNSEDLKKVYGPVKGQ